MKQRERLVRRLPLPLKQAAKSVRNRLDPVFMWAYRRRTGDTRPFPPGSIRARAGAYSVTIWARTGEASAAQLAEGLKRAGTSFGEIDSVLDFGCGAGRIVPNLLEQCAPSVRFAGCDVDVEAIAWAREHYPNVELRVNDAMPPMPFGDREFDVVYSNSIYTHLDERVQDAWLADMHRVLRPGGIALLTTHGPYAYGEFHARRILTNTKDCTDRVSAHGSLADERFIHEPYVINSLNARDFPGVDATFGVAFHDPRYIDEHWSKWFEIVTIMPRQMVELQDLVVCRKPELVPPAAEG